MRLPTLFIRLFLPTAAVLAVLQPVNAAPESPDSAAVVDSVAAISDSMQASATGSADTLSAQETGASVRDTAAGHDSLTVRADSAAERTLRLDSVSAGAADSAAVDSTRPLPDLAPGLAAEAAMQDTGYSFWHYPFIGGSVAWGLGSFPVFHQWRHALPDSLSSMGLTSPLIVPATDVLSDTGALFDTLDLIYDTKEPPSSYNISFPIGLSAGFATNEHRHLGLDASFIFARKVFQAVARDDSMTSHVAIRQTLGFYSASLALSYHYSIPERYFAVNGVDQSWLSLGIGLNPLVYLRKSGEIRTPHGSDSLLAVVRDHMSARFGDFSGYGMGASWRVGFTTMRKLSPHTGVQTGLHYVGRWFRLPRTRRNDISYQPVNNDTKPLSFISHRLLIRLALVRGKKPPDKPAIQTGMPSPAADHPSPESAGAADRALESEQTQEDEEPAPEPKQPEADPDTDEPPPQTDEEQPSAP